MWYEIKNQNVVVRVYAKPNAKRTALVKVADDALHISLHARPQEGEANKELIVFVSTIFKLPKSKVTLLRGESSRYKMVEIPLSDGVLKLLETLKDQT